MRLRRGGGQVRERAVGGEWARGLEEGLGRTWSGAGCVVVADVTQHTHQRVELPAEVAGALVQPDKRAECEGDGDGM